MTRARHALLICALLVACSNAPLHANNTAPARTAQKLAQATPDKPAKRGGGYYLDDGPADTIPVDLAGLPDAEPRAEPLHRFANNPYSVFGQEYVPLRQPMEFRQRGVASWYGRRFHGQRTSSGEPYDMFAMTAAHPTLPIPSFVRVTNPANGKSVVVRVNDRGPFHPGRVIDLSYAAAWKLGYAGAGSTLVELESIVPEGAALLALQASAKYEPDPIERIILNDAKNNRAPPVELPEVNEPRGIFLQLGAFSSRDNADSFLAHIARELGPLAERLAVHAAEGRFRLRMGPYANQAEARSAAERVREMLAVTPVVVTR